MKYLIFFSALLIAFSSCSDTLDELDSSVPCKEIISFDDMPEPDFLDGYYTELITEFTLQELESCECEDLIAIQDFKNQKIGKYWEGYMPMILPCQELMTDCSKFEGLEVEEIIESFIPTLDQGVSRDYMSKEEHNILADFFNDYFGPGLVDYDSYWCRLTDADRSNVVNQGPAGLPGVFTLTIFQGVDEFVNDNAQYFSSNTIQTRKWQMFAFRKIFNKWATSMDICFEGIANNVCVSHEAIDNFLD